jgi:hypothetical protein
MAWWDDAAEAVGSGLGWVGDAAEAVVDTVTEVAEEVTESATDAADAGLDALRDGAASVGPALGAVANVVLGLVKGAVHAVADLAAIAFDVVRNVGKLASDILHLNLADIIADLGNIGIDILQAVFVWGVRLVTGAYFGKEISDYFMRDRALTFIRTLIIDEFGKKDGEDILRKLGSGGLHFGLPIAATVRIMRADSNSFPFVPLHNGHLLDLYALAGLLSFDSFRMTRERTRVVRVDASGRDMWWLPINRYAIRSFLASGGTTMRIRAYAMAPYAAAKAMRTAFRKFKKLCIDIGWATSFNFPSFRTFPTQPCRNVSDFVLPDDPPGIDALWFALSTPRNGQPDQDAIPLCIAIFAYVKGLNGLTTGRIIKRGAPGCSGSDTTDACITDIARHMRDFGLDLDGDGVADRPDSDTGCGCTWRDTYPPFFSRLVLAHELGHYFGLAHAGHSGFDKIMISAEGTPVFSSAWFRIVFGLDTWWRAWLYGDAVFTEEDVENTWRFIVKKTPHVLRAL